MQNIVRRILASGNVLHDRTAEKAIPYYTIPAYEACASSLTHPAEEIEVIEALPILGVGAVSVALLAEKTELIENTRTDDITLRHKTNKK